MWTSFLCSEQDILTIQEERNRNGKLLKLQGYKDLICNKHVNGLVFILQINLISCLGNL